MSVLLRRSFKTAIFSTFLKVAIATSNFMIEVYNGSSAPEFSVPMSKVPSPTSVTAKEKSSRKKKNFRGKRSTLEAKINWLQQKKKARGKTKMLAAKKKLVTLIASAKIPEREGSISLSSFYG